MEQNTANNFFSTLNTSAENHSTVADTLSIQKDVLGKYVYNDDNDNIGTIEDLLVTEDKFISYAIVGVGGFLGVGRHDVAIPLYQLVINKSQITLPGASAENLKTMKQFEYR